MKRKWNLKAEAEFILDNWSNPNCTPERIQRLIKDLLAENQRYRKELDPPSRIGRTSAVVILNAEFPAGIPIKDAISEALDFSERNRCILRCSINDTTITVVAGLLPKDQAVDYYLGKYMEDQLIAQKSQHPNGN